jgi:hypothetical protein
MWKDGDQGDFVCVRELYVSVPLSVSVSVSVSVLPLGISVRYLYQSPSKAGVFTVGYLICVVRMHRFCSHGLSGFRV